MIRGRGNRKHRAEVEVEVLPEAKNESPNGNHSSGTMTIPGTSHQSCHNSAQNGISEHIDYSDTDRPSPTYIPPNPPSGCKEFTSSAVIIKAPSGDLEAMKPFYDTMSTDNWASEDFVKAFGFQKRPILPAHLKRYETVNGYFIPQHYIEIELKDKSRGINEFVGISLNVTPAMDGIGLIAGSDFMLKHRIKVNPTARDGYVTTNRKADAGKIQNNSKQ